MAQLRVTASAEGCRPGLPHIGWHSTGQRVMEMDEQSSDKQQPGIWESWTAASANPSSEPTVGEPSQARYSGQPAESGPAGAPGQASQLSMPDATGQLPAFTQPIGYPQAGYPASGYGQPGY